jgi:hypothetical protein
MLVELLVRPYRCVNPPDRRRLFLNLIACDSETWGTEFAAGDQDDLLVVWKELLGVAIVRSTSKGFSASRGVYDPFATLMQEIPVEVDDSRYASSSVNALRQPLLLTLCSK